MSDFINNIPEFTVSEFSQTLKKAVEGQFSYVKIRGELSNCKVAASGHLYCGLKDESSMIDGICWRGQMSKLNFTPQDGLDVICTGRITTYPGRSKYQIVIDVIEIAGEGALLKLLEERKKKLAAEGLFDEKNKKPLPYLPQTIAVITSPTGAVIRDILHRIQDRFPCQILLWAVQVQGDNAARDITKAFAQINDFKNLARLNIPKPDLIILARGGGSLEDLMPFNEEMVVRAIAGSLLPVISAIGHETDWSLSDFVADWRAPTPTGAAEKAVPERQKLWENLLDFHYRYYAAHERLLTLKGEHLFLTYRAIPKPHYILDEYQQNIDERAERLEYSFKNYTHIKDNQLEKCYLKLKHPGEHLLALTQASQNLFDKLMILINRQFDMSKHQFEVVLSGLQTKKLAENIEFHKKNIVQIKQQITRSIQQNIDDAHRKHIYLNGLLESYSYQHVLKRGFVLMVDENDIPLCDSYQIKDPIQKMTLHFRDKKISGFFTKQNKSIEKKSENSEKTATTQQLKLF